MTTLLRRSAFVAFMSVLCFFLVIPTASAYLDPGTGSMVFQAVIAGVMAAGVTIKVFWRRILGLFSGNRVKDRTERR